MACGGSGGFGLGGRHELYVAQQILRHPHVLAAHRTIGDRFAAALRERARRSGQHRAVDDRQCGIEALDVAAYGGLKLSARLKWDADVHHADRRVELARLDIVTQDRPAALHDFRQRRADLAQSNNQGLPVLHLVSSATLFDLFHAARSGS